MGGHAALDVEGGGEDLERAARRVRTAAPRTFGPERPSSRIFLSEARISATPPSAGEQNMYLVSGSETMSLLITTCRPTGSRRQACGVFDAFSNAFTATRPRLVSLMP